VSWGNTFPFCFHLFLRTFQQPNPFCCNRSTTNLFMISFLSRTLDFFSFFLSLWIYLWLAETSQQPISQTTWLKVTPHCNHWRPFFINIVIPAKGIWSRGICFLSQLSLCLPSYRHLMIYTAFFETSHKQHMSNWRWNEDHIIARATWTTKIYVFPKRAFLTARAKNGFPFHSFNRGRLKQSHCFLHFQTPLLQWVQYTRLQQTLLQIMSQTIPVRAHKETTRTQNPPTMTHTLNHMQKVQRTHIHTHTQHSKCITPSSLQVPGIHPQPLRGLSRTALMWLAPWASIASLVTSWSVAWVKGRRQQ